MVALNIAARQHLVAHQLGDLVSLDRIDRVAFDADRIDRAAPGFAHRAVDIVSHPTPSQKCKRAPRLV
jgi:hypothetical protein